MPHGVEEDVVGEYVEVLLFVAIAVSALRAGKGPAESALVDGAADLACRLNQLLHCRRYRRAPGIAADVGVQNRIECRCRHLRPPPARQMLGFKDENKTGRVSKF